jgi:hypothetical protein
MAPHHADCTALLPFACLLGLDLNATENQVSVILVFLPDSETSIGINFAALKFKLKFKLKIKLKFKHLLKRIK